MRRGRQKKAATNTGQSALSNQRGNNMRGKANSAIQSFNRIFSSIVEGRIPMCIWLDFTTCELYKTRLRG
jgi:hypothetical protein